MRTKYVSGAIYIPCPGCKRELGPYSQVTSGDLQCGHCKTVFTLVL